MASDKITRDRQINVKLTEKEYANMKSKALEAGISMSDYIRRKVTRPGGEELAKILRSVIRAELKRVA